MRGTKSFSFLFISVLISIIAALCLYLLLQFCRFPVSSSRWRARVETNQGTITAVAETEGSLFAVVEDTNGGYQLFQLRKHWLLPWYQKPEAVAAGVSAGSDSVACCDYAEYLEVTFSAEHIQVTVLRPFQDRQWVRWDGVPLAFAFAVLIWNGIYWYSRRKRQPRH